jgi:hypothetical protein
MGVIGSEGSNADSSAALSGIGLSDPIAVPEGESEDDLITALYWGHQAVDNARAKYDPLGGKFGGVNSNSYARTLAQLGGILTQFSAYASQFNVGKINTAPGSRKSVPLGDAKNYGVGDLTGKFIGTYDFGPEIGTYDFGKQEWVPTSGKK